MGVNQVIYGGETVMDITDSTVTEETLVEGAVAYNAAGERIVGTGSYIPVPASAAVGQTIKVSEVDENGKPTAWEAVDFPSGDGGMELIASGELTEETTAITISADNNGNPFELQFASLGILIQPTATNSGNGSLRFRTNVNTAALGGQATAGNTIRVSTQCAVEVKFQSIKSIFLDGFSYSAGARFGSINQSYDALTAIYMAGIDSGKQTFGVGTSWELWGIRA